MHDADLIGTVLRSAEVMRTGDSFKVFDQIEIYRLAQSEDVEERKREVKEPKNNFSIFPEESKNQAWDDLHRLTQDKDDSVRRLAATIAKGKIFLQVP